MKLESERVLKELVSEQDKYLMEFLKSKGYRPKPTIKYVKDLMRRLKSKGLKLKYYSSIDYGIPEKVDGGTTFKGKIKMLYFIDSIDNPISGVDFQQMLDNWKGN